MRDRLIELLEGKSIDQPCDVEYVADFLLSEGIIVPPVKVGQTVWFIRPLKYKDITETEIEKIVVKNGGLYLKLACNAMYETSCNSIGKTVFLTRGEAEKVIAERRAGQ